MVGLPMLPVLETQQPTLTNPPSAMILPASIQQGIAVQKIPPNAVPGPSPLLTPTPASTATVVPQTIFAQPPPQLQQTQQQQQPQQQHDMMMAGQAPHIPFILSSHFTTGTQCAWFKMSEIHDIEKAQMAEFFNGRSPSKTPEVYKEYRDFMINTYQQNPYQYLTLTAVRRNLVGDICSMMRVHSFLDHWGLINYFINPEGGYCIPAPQQPKPQTQQQPDAIKSPNKTSPSLTTTTSTSTTTTTTSTTTTTTSSSAAEPSSSSTITKPANGNSNSGSSSNINGTITPSSRKINPLELRSNIYGQPQVPPKIVCSNCGVDCSALRHQLNKSLTVPEGATELPPDLLKVNLCNSCFQNGNYAQEHTASDFTMIQQEVSPDPPEEWTDQETLLLLEAIDIYGDSWADVAEHVATKTKEQCLLHFLRLPIEDNYLEDNLSKATNMKQSNQSSSNQQLTSTTNGHEIMTMIGFLSKAVSANVATAAAKAAHEVLAKDMKGEINETLLNIQSASAATLAATSIKANSMKLAEERDIQSLILQIVSLQTKKLEIKLKYYSDLEGTLDRERILMEKSRQTLFLDRLNLLKEHQQHLAQTKDNSTSSGTMTNINGGTGDTMQQ
ncbi:hypothetical protein SAMD00019534_026540 [Acytostelium subglobosum LB1]|uniref:hypothetical protein n=1 Tax=Acytostelium subglobosum LB1 TaxID=1410327 RepID=UPI0006450D6B|nr:hypothetical protein SAMD00019534_026540 [Acytostelium subglobosum LB1]GAM19479.1 hypothetical protein SAMD00019534_026540 [Acytostelium subglobosum LB1]|eukprot:XP_012757406.1 hypothetical protein SAMD00019534_026540 [Acytostelium subglobosum LB1]